MRYAIVGLAIAASLFAGAAVGAPTAKQLDLSDRYLKTMKLQENMERSITTSLPQMMDAMAKGVGLPEKLKPDLSEVVSESMNELMPKLFAVMRVAVAETYSEDELSAVIAFYETPVGQAIISKSAAYSARLTPEVAKMMVEYQQSIMRRTVEKLCGDGQCQRTPSAPEAAPS